MSPWDRLIREMTRRRKTLEGLALATGASRQSIGHWGRRGIPARHLRAAADFVGRSMDWLEFGVDADPELSAAVQAIAKHLETLPSYDKATVVSLFTTLAHSPHLHRIVADGLADLCPKADDEDADSKPATLL